MPRNNGRTPDAKGSSVPPWPTRFVAGEPADECHDVVRRQAGRLRHDEDPVKTSAQRRIEPRSAIQRADEALGLFEDRRTSVREWRVQ